MLSSKGVALSYSMPMYGLVPSNITFDEESLDGLYLPVNESMPLRVVWAAGG